MRTMAHYLIIMLSIMLLIFRLIVVFTTTMGIEFMIQSLNVNFEIAMLFIMIVCIILLTKNKLSGAIIFVLISLAYYGPDLINKITYMSSNNISIDIATQTVVSVISIIIPIFAFFIIALAKQQERKPVDKKTDFFYKNEAYDIKHDDRDDRNNYRTR